MGSDCKRTSEYSIYASFIDHLRAVFTGLLFASSVRLIRLSDNIAMASTQLIVFCRIGDTSDHRDPDDLHQTVFAVMLTTRLFWLLAFAYCLQTAISLAVPRDLLTDPSFDSADLNITSLVQQLILQHTPRTGNDTQSKSSPRIVKRGPGLVFPTFMPTNDPDFPRIMSAYTEAIVLAAVTFKEMSQCDAVWQRYFLDEDWDWVRSK